MEVSKEWFLLGGSRIFYRCPSCDYQVSPAAQGVQGAFPTWMLAVQDRGQSGATGNGHGFYLVPSKTSF